VRCGGTARVERTILLRARREVRGCCSHHHASCLMGDADEEVVNLLQVDFGHVVWIELWRKAGEKEKMKWEWWGKQVPIFADSLSTRADGTGIKRVSK
jgi:hypothetical protein